MSSDPVRLTPDTTGPSSYLKGLSIRRALVGGFAVVFAAWLLSGYELVRSLQEVERRIADAREASARTERTLSSIRIGVLLGSIYLRDALVDTGSAVREQYRDELTSIRTNIEHNLPALEREAESTDQRRYAAELRVALDMYWSSLDIVFGRDAPRNVVQGSGVIRRQVVPARENVLKMVDTLAELQQLTEQQHASEVSVMYARVRTRVLAIGAVAILVGIAVAVAAGRHVGRLQREIEAQRQAEQQARRDLQRLSARLVTAQEEERRSLARELHDVVGQSLTAIKMEMGVAMRGLGAESRAKASLEEARGLADATLQNVRDLSQFLHPSTLDDFGLPDTIRGYLRSFGKRTGIRAQLLAEGMDQRLPGEMEAAIYRIVQEATTNVARHSGAANCVVTLARQDAALRLTIDDDGLGFEQADTVGAARRGLGLIAMRERAEGLKGALVIERRAGGGTRVLVRVPFTVADVADVADLRGAAASTAAAG